MQTILVCDDDKQIVEAIDIYLTGEGFQVIKAYDGTTDLPDGKISLVSAAGSAGYQAGLPLPLSEGNGFELTDAKYDSANASETEKNISFTVKLTDTNYTFEDGTTERPLR